MIMTGSITTSITIITATAAFRVSLWSPPSPSLCPAPYRRLNASPSPQQHDDDGDGDDGDDDDGDYDDHHYHQQHHRHPRCFVVVPTP